MKLTIPNIYEPIHLKDYAPEFGDATIWVWVNPTRKLLSSIGELKEETDVFSWYAEIWNREDTPWTADDVRELANSAVEQDPRLWTYITQETVRLILDHRKKKVASSSVKP